MRPSHLAIVLIAFGAVSGLAGHAKAGWHGGGGIHRFGGSPHFAPAFHPRASAGWRGPVRMGNYSGGPYSSGHSSAWHVAAGWAYGGSSRGGISPGSWHVNTGAGLAPSGAWHVATGYGMRSNAHGYGWSGHGGNRWSSGFGYRGGGGSYYQRTAYGQGFGGGSSYVVSGDDGGYGGSYDQGYGGGSSYSAPSDHQVFVSGGSYEPAGYSEDDIQTYEPLRRREPDCACYRRGFGPARSRDIVPTADRGERPRFHYEWVRRRVYDHRVRFFEPLPASYGRSRQDRDYDHYVDGRAGRRFGAIETRY